MTRKIKIAAVQMDATPLPVPQRLDRAASVITQAAGEGAQLIVLPEVFNTGYEYSDQNFALAEPMDGQTVSWMKTQAAQHNIHLAGSLLLLDGLHVYNTQLLIAPDGRVWRYDKNYPWAWERAYFREGHGVTVAETDLGNFGMLICWDYSHPELWQQYAGRVDAMIVTSCPPILIAPTIIFPDGEQFSFDDLAMSYHGDDMPFGKDLDAMTAWLGVPLAHTTGSGRLHTRFPAAKMTAGAMLATRPPLLQKYFSQLDDVTAEAGYFAQTKIVDAGGNVLSRVTGQDDAYTIAEVELADEKPKPSQPMPKNPFTFYAYFASDTFIPAVMTSIYRTGYRRQFGQHMAPVDSRTKTWLAALVGMFGLGFLLGRSR